MNFFLNWMLQIQLFDDIKIYLFFESTSCFLKDDATKIILCIHKILIACQRRKLERKNIIIIMEMPHNSNNIIFCEKCTLNILRVFFDWHTLCDCYHGGVIIGDERASGTDNKQNYHY